LSDSGTHQLFWTTAGELYARGTNADSQLGDASTTTRTSSVRVYPLAPTFLNGTGTLSTQTSSATGTITLSVSAAGEPTPSYQWQMSKDGGNTWSDITGKTSSTATIFGLSVDDLGAKYRVKVSNAAGTVYSTATTFVGNPNFSITPAEQNILRGTSRKLTVTGALLADVTWTIQGATSEDTEIADDGTLSIGADETARSLTITAVDDTVTGGFGSARVNIVYPSLLAAGATHSLFVSNDGVLYAAGSNNAGQLGIGTSDSDAHTEPVVVKTNLPDGVKIVSVAAGGFTGERYISLYYSTTVSYPFSLYVTSEGKVYGFGSNAYNQLGTTNSGNILTPTQIVLPDNAFAVAVFAGDYHSLVLTNDGRVFAFGENYSGQLGNALIYTMTTPTEVTPTGEFIIGIATEGSGNTTSSYGHTLFLTSAGRLYQAGKFPLFSETALTDITPDELKIVAVAVGKKHNLLLTEEGKVYSYGSNSYGELGQGNTDYNFHTEVQDITPAGTVVVSVYADDYRSYFIDSTGKFYAFGDNYNGALGFENSGYINYDITTPTVVKINDTPVNVIDVAAGENHAIFKTAGGQIYAMGANQKGQLGFETTSYSMKTSTPQIVHVPAAPSFVVGEELPATISVGGTTTLTLTVGVGGYPAPTYQWERSNDNGTTWFSVAGSGNSLVLNSITPDDNNARIRVRATNTYGTTGWQETLLTGITDPFNPFDIAGLSTKGVKLTAPKVPKGVKLAKGTKARWEWYKDGVLYTGAKSAATFAAKEGGVWSVKLFYTPLGSTKEVSETRDFGTVKIVDVIKINKTTGFVFTTAGATMKTFSDPAIAVEGDTRTLRLSLEQGTGPFTYRFFENNIQKEVRANTYKTTQEWTVTMPAADGKGKIKTPSYKVVVESVAGTNGKPLSKVTTKTLKPKIYVLPRLTATATSPRSTDGFTVVSPLNKTVSFSVKVAGTKKIEYRWFKGTETGAAGTIVISNSAKLSISTYGLDAYGAYYCEVRNPATDGWVRINPQNFVLRVSP